MTAVWWHRQHSLWILWLGMPAPSMSHRTSPVCTTRMRRYTQHSCPPRLATFSAKGGLRLQAVSSCWGWKMRACMSCVSGRCHN